MATRPVYVTSEERAHFANDELSGMLERFAIGEVRSVVTVTAWADGGEPGGAYHIETTADRKQLIGHMRAMIRILENL